MNALFSVDQAVARLMGFRDHMFPYRLGAGGHRVIGPDTPWSPDPFGVVGCDCWGAIRFAYGLPSHLPGFNKNAYPRFDILDVEDDINANSAIGDARHTRALFVEIASPGEPIRPGDILTYPTIMLVDRLKTNWILNDDSTIRRWIGHGAIVVDAWGSTVGKSFSNIQILQCYGPNDRRPAICQTDGSVFDHHDSIWPNFEHRTTVLRVQHV